MTVDYLPRNTKFCEKLSRFSRKTKFFHDTFTILVGYDVIPNHKISDNDKCAECPKILEELETIDDDTDKHGIQFVKSKDAKLAAEIGIFSFPALVYYETGVPIMYDGNIFSLILKLHRNSLQIIIAIILPCRTRVASNRRAENHTNCERRSACF